MNYLQILRATTGFLGAKFFGRRIPLAIGWDVTNRCNRRCLYCGFGLLPTEEMNTVQALEMIDQIAKAGAVRIHLSGGEPMMRDDIGELISRISSHGIFCALNTNGHQIAERIDEVKRVDLIRLSYDGPKDIQEALRGKGAYAEMDSALQTAKENRIRVVLNATINALNVEQVAELLAFAEENGCRIKFQPIFEGLAYGKEIGRHIPGLEAFRKAVLFLKERKGAGDFWLVNSMPNLDYYLVHPETPYIPCVAGILYARMNPIGMLYPCSMKMIKPLMRDARSLGFLEAFRSLPPVNCKDCVCPPTLELNFLYSLKWKSILNLGKYL